MNILLGLTVLLLVFFALGQIPLAVGGSYSNATPTAWVKIFFVQIALLPQKEKKNKKTKPKKAKEPTDEKKKMSVPEILALVLDLIPVLQRALGRFYGKLRMDQFLLQVILPGEDDPAGSAIRYGQINATLVAIWEPLVEMLHIQDGHVGVHVDFTADKMELEAKGILSIRLGQLLAIAVTLAVHALYIFLRHRRQNKLRKAVS